MPSSIPPPESWSRHIQTGTRITGQVSLTPDEIAHFAQLSGDLNPLHHDADYAQHTRFGGIIVSGPQITSLMMGLTATYFSQNGAMLGLEFSFRFRQAVLANEPIAMLWEITSNEFKASLHGELVTLDGQATNQQGQVVLTGTGKVLVVEKL